MSFEDDQQSMMDNDDSEPLDNEDNENDATAAPANGIDQQDSDSSLIPSGWDLAVVV